MPVPSSKLPLPGLKLHRTTLLVINCTYVVSVDPKIRVIPPEVVNFAAPPLFTKTGWPAERSAAPAVPLQVVRPLAVELPGPVTPPPPLGVAVQLAVPEVFQLITSVPEPGTHAPARPARVTPPQVGRALEPLLLRTCPEVPKLARDWSVPVDVVPPASRE